MAVRSLDQILAEQSKFSDPSRQAILGQISNLPQEQQAAESGLNAKLQDRLSGITAEANRKGNFYSGLPIAEQQKYTATEYAPALAGLQSNYLDKRTSLTNTLAGLNANDYATANSIYGNEQSLAEQQRQFDLNYQLQQQQARQAAAQNASLASVLGGQGGQTQSRQAPPASVVQRGSDFQFKDQTGKPITAAQYASATGQDIRSVLQTMGNAGDPTAQAIYNNILRDPQFNTPQGYARYAQQYSYIFGGV